MALKAHVIGQCKVFSKIELIYAEFTLAMFYIAKISFVKIVVSLATV